MNFRRMVENAEEGAAEILAPWASESAQVFFLAIGVGGPVIVYEALKGFQAIVYCQISPEMCDLGIRALFSLYP